MKNQISPAEEKVAVMLAKGYTQKETANHLNKSVRTVSRQVDDIYHKTECRNLADLTRFVIRRYSGVPTEEILMNAIKDMFVVVFIIAAALVLSNTHVFEMIQTSLINSIK